MEKKYVAKDDEIIIVGVEKDEPIAKRIRIILAKEYLSPSEFAKKSKIDPAQVSRLQKDASTISSKLLVRISKAFNVCNFQDSFG